MQLTIIDYKAGNIKNIQNAFQKALINLNVDETNSIEVSDNHDVIQKAKILVFPGVGSAGEAMKNLKKLDLTDAIKSKIASGTPFLGICLGMQILFEHSEEQDTECLGILKGKVRRFDFIRLKAEDGRKEIGNREKEVLNIEYSIFNTSQKDEALNISNPKKLKIPHMGWNQVIQDKKSIIWNNIPDQSYFYHVHSYHAVPEEDSTIGSTNYGYKFASAVQRDNLTAVQFHPEKSGATGLKVIENFLMKSLKK